MITVLEAFEAMGMALKDSETVCIATAKGSRFYEQSLHDVAHEPVGANRYFSTGTFPRSQKWGRGGRAFKNVQRILELPFDFDLKDFLHQDKEDIYDLSTEELEGYIPLLQNAVEDVFTRVGLPIHRLDYTGYGLSAHVLLPPHKPDATKQIRDWHAAIVNRINGIYGDVLADAQVKDAGSRIMRLVPCENIGTREDGTKATPRQSRNIYMRFGYVDQAQLEQAAGAISWKGVSVDIPLTGDVLSEEEAQQIVDTYKPFHTHGQKHFMGLAIAGQLGKARVPEEQALAIVTKLSEGDNKPWDRQKAVRDTYDRIRNGQDVIGYHALKTIVDEEAISTVDKLLEKVRRKNEPRLILMNERRNAGTVDDDVKLFNPPPIPEKAFYGWHRQYLDLVYPTTGAALAFHLAGSTTLQAAMMGRRIATTYAGSRVFPSQFAVCVGRTGNSFKDTGYNRTMEMVENAQKLYLADQTIINTGFTVEENFSSREALIDSLINSKNIYLFSTEITSLFKNATRESTSTLLDALINLWDTPRYISTNSMRAKVDDRDRAVEPILNIYGCTQPTRVGEYMTETMIASGLGNRLAFFMGNARAKLPRTPKMDERASAELYMELHRRIRSYPEGAVVDMSEEAGARWDDWYLNIPEEVDELANDMKVRHPMMVQKWALMFAVSDGAQEINVDHLETAITIVEWMWSCIQRYLPSWGVAPERKIEERIITVLEQRQPMTKRDLNRYVRGKWTAREFAGVYRAMKENQQIVESADGKYVALSDHAMKDQGVA